MPSLRRSLGKPETIVERSSSFGTLGMAHALVHTSRHAQTLVGISPYLRIIGDDASRHLRVRITQRRCDTRTDGVDGAHHLYLRQRGRVHLERDPRETSQRLAVSHDLVDNLVRAADQQRHWPMRWSQSFLRKRGCFGMLCRRPRRSWLETFNANCGLHGSIVRGHRGSRPKSAGPRSGSILHFQHNFPATMRRTGEHFMRRTHLCQWHDGPDLWDHLAAVE